MERMKATAEAFGFDDFEPSDWMGLEDHVLYHLNLPTQRSTRSYHKGKHDTHGIFANRVAVDTEKLNQSPRQLSKKIVLLMGRLL